MNQSGIPAITASDLTKMYGERAALSHGNFEVPQGSICGFVGPNGSGKTTTIRMLLGLIKPSGGSATVLGESISNPERYLPKVGAMIEGPAFYPALSGRENLKVLAELGGFPLSRVDQLLAKVDLADRGGSKFKTYSLGMKQRLGIAAALLPNPELLILDEPTNGLDPSGIQEVRGIIRGLADSGTTVFVSSHILSELEMICEYLVMLREGKVIFSGRTEELLSNQKPMIIAKPEYDVDLTNLANKLKESGYNISIVNGSIHIDAAKEVSPAINRMAFEVGITLASISVILPTLEETFFEMTGDSK
jgi:ABC-2 type transport system ATP-binding protein